MIPSKEKIEEIILKLQKILRIQDWDFTLELLNEREMKGMGREAQATTKINRELKVAGIYLNVECTENWYQSIVHELLHLTTDPVLHSGCHMMNFLDSSVKDSLNDHFMVGLEQSVNELSKIICTLYPVNNFIKEGEDNAESN